MDEPRTIWHLRRLGIELALTSDRSGVRVRNHQSTNLTPEIRADIAEHEADFLRALLFREAASFVSQRLKEAGLSWHDPAHDAAAQAFNDPDHQERLNKAWSEADPEPLKDVLRLCARSGVRAISPSPPDTSPRRQHAEDNPDGTASPGQRWDPGANLPGNGRGPQNARDPDPQLPLDVS